MQNVQQLIATEYPPISTHKIKQKCINTYRTLLTEASQEIVSRN